MSERASEGEWPRGLGCAVLVGLVALGAFVGARYGPFWASAALVAALVFLRTVGRWILEALVDALEDLKDL